MAKRIIHVKHGSVQEDVHKSKASLEDMMASFKESLARSQSTENRDHFSKPKNPKRNRSGIASGRGAKHIQPTRYEDVKRHREQYVKPMHEDIYQAERKHREKRSEFIRMLMNQSKRFKNIYSLPKGTMVFIKQNLQTRGMNYAT